MKAFDSTPKTLPYPKVSTVDFLLLIHYGLFHCTIESKGHKWDNLSDFERLLGFCGLSSQ